jgi:hypothetical protein
MVASEGGTVRDLAYPKLAKNKIAGLQYFSVLNIIVLKLYYVL